jgi:hypothetical protein
MTKRWGLLILLSLVTPFMLGEAGCDGDSRQKEREIVERQDKRYIETQPPPSFDWSLERHMFTQLYEARNKSVATFSYVRNQYTGKVMSWCASLGFPIPANTQLTNPMKLAYDHTPVPQSEPNGLYSSPSTRGTYVMCVRKGGKVVPRYYEQDVETYVTPMVERDGQLVEAEGVAPSLEIDVSRKP